MFNRKRIQAMVAGMLLGFATAVPAEVVPPQDIDLFMGVDSEITVPNVLFLIDASANWNADIAGTPGETLTREGLRDLLTRSDSLVNEINVGLLQFADGRAGKVISQIRPLDEEYQKELDVLLDRTATLADGRSLTQANNAPYAMAMHEAFLYYTGGRPTADALADGDHDPAAITDGGRYNTPVGGNCGKNFVIAVGHGAPDSGEDDDAENALRDLGGVLAGDPISLDPSQFESNWADEFARFMSGNDVIDEDLRDGNRNIITYVIDVFDPDNSPRPGSRPHESTRSWFRSMAREGQGRYFAVNNTAEFQAALTEIIDEIQAINSVFAASTLPVSVNVRGTNLNQVYMGVFRPDEQRRPRWPGNLKLYTIALDEDGNPFLADANVDPIRNPVTGFVRDNAVSYWTENSDFWAFDPRGNPPSASDLPDGPLVEKGGAAQMQRNQFSTTGAIGSRTIFTNKGTAMVNISDAGLDGDLEDWIRGMNHTAGVDEDDPDLSSKSTVRPSLHGDVLHSRPAVINLGEDVDDEIYVFYGSNDGMFRGIRGGIAGARSGEEMWSFVPEEFIGDLDALRRNEAPEKDQRGKKYFADGDVTVHFFDDGTKERIFLYIGMRRGGDFIYALEVTDPEKPRIAWRVGADDPDFGELAETWSSPIPTQIRNESGDAVPVVFFGAGYDAANDDWGYGQTITSGRGIYMVHALTGDLLWEAGPEASLTGGLIPGLDLTPASFPVKMQHSIAADLMVLDTTRNGFADRIYAADTGGNVWRANIASQNLGDWNVRHLASLGEDQKFFYPPNVVLRGDSDRDYDAILLGSGNREDPLDMWGPVDSYFYMLKDRGTAEGDTIVCENKTAGTCELFDATDNTIQSGTEEEQADAIGDLAGARGWYFELLGEGEKVVSGSLTTGGVTTFNTNQPAPPEPGSCVSNLGIAREYQVSFTDATIPVTGGELGPEGRWSEVAGGGFPPTPVSAIVEIDGQIVEVRISGTDAQRTAGGAIGAREKVWWNREQAED